MASFGANGLVIDRLADIRAEIEADLRESFGDGIDLGEDSPFGILLGIMSERYSTIYELLEAVYLASFPNTAFGIYLDELAAFNGVVREAATASTVNLTFTRSNDLSGGDVNIPAGTQATASGGSTVIWTTDSAATILDGEATTTVSATANVLGATVAVADTIDTLVAAVANVGAVTNPQDATPGNNAETDAELRARRQLELGRAGTSTESGIRSALVLLDEVRNAALILNDTDVAVGDLPPHSINASISPATGFNLGMLGTLVYNAPFVASNSVEVTIDGSPIAGSPVLFNTDNATTLADIATALEAEDLVAFAESDASDTINIQGATGADFVVATLVTGGASQPVGLFTQTDAAGDTLDVIAQTLWDSKAAGIQTFGDFTGQAVDTSGDLHDLQFSQIDEVRLWVRYTLTVDGEYESGTAEPAIAAALAEWATLNLTGGVDVLNYKLLCAASDVGSAGILGIVTENSLDGVSFSAVNRTIDPNEFASIDSADVSFVYP